MLTKILSTHDARWACRVGLIVFGFGNVSAVVIAALAAVHRVRVRFHCRYDKDCIVGLFAVSAKPAVSSCSLNKKSQDLAGLTDVRLVFDLTEFVRSCLGC